MFDCKAVKTLILSITMSEVTNSAKQLYNILREARTKDGQTATHNVWIEILGVDNSSHTDIHFKLGDLMSLFNNTRNDIRQLHYFNTTKFLKALDKLQAVVINSATKLSSSWGSLKDQIEEETLELIDACGDLLIAQSKILQEISPKELQELQQQIRDLQDEIINSDIDSETKQFLINELRKIEDAILNYRVRGASGIVQVSEEVTGKTLIKGLQLFDKAREMTGKVINLAIKVNSLASVGERLHNLPEGLKDLTKFLPPGNGN